MTTMQSMPAPRRAPPASFPRGALLGAGALVLLSLAAASAGRLTGAGAVHGDGHVTVERALRFADRADGAVVVTEPGRAAPVAVITGQSGFLRGTLRGLARVRHQDGAGPEQPFRLAAWSDGRLTLDDPLTGGHVELSAFGPDNAAVFARLLRPDGGTP